MTVSENQKNGLTAAQVTTAREKYGDNRFSRAKTKGFWRCFLENLGDPVIKVLLLALCFDVVLLFRSHQWFETVGIAVSVFLATFISTLSEHGSETAFLKLQAACETPTCRVRRGGRTTQINTADVVVGDVLLLSAGESIPADGLLFLGGVTVDQSALTGESREVEKRPARRGEEVSPAAPGALFAGCTVLAGDGEAVVTAVGDATFLGGISGELQSGSRESPLRQRLTRLAGQISMVGYIAAALCVFCFLFHRLLIDTGFDMAQTLLRLRNLPYMAALLLRALMFGLTVVVVAVPEGLPMMIAVVLSSNIRRMVRDKVLVRKPAGLEAAGNMNILFTDKTGTLTLGRLTPVALLTGNGDFADFRRLQKAAPLLASRLANAAYGATGAEWGVSEGAPAILGGNSTDRALLSAFPAPSGGLSPRRKRLPFDSNRKFSATETADGVYVMGAPERLLPHVRWVLDDMGQSRPFEREAFLLQLQKHTGAGERVILLCEGEHFPGEHLEPPLTLLAAICFSDPLRPEAAASVAVLRRAAVQVVMITGDGKETAARIAKECGILRRDGLCFEGGELAALTDQELREIIPRLAVVARALPGDKSRLVRLCAEAGLVVGMTGDGINDAPALAAADVGFAMGSGTGVAKEAGDVVILDDNLASITRAVLYGRTIFKSIRKFITLQLIMNFCAVGISIIGPFIGYDSPVTVVQMLWINMVMDTLGGLAFAGEAPLDHYMQEAPRGREEPILTKAIAGRIAVLTTFTVALSVFFLKSSRIRGFYRESSGDLCLLTAFFALFIFAGVFNCFNARTDRVRMAEGLSRNRAFLLIMPAVAGVQILFTYLGGTVLRTLPLTPKELLITFLLSLSVIPVGWLHLIWRRLSGKAGLY